LFLVKSFHNFPEPSHDFVIGIVGAFVFGVGSPILDVDVGHSVEQHFDLEGLKNLEELLWDDLVESFADEVDRSLHFLPAQCGDTQIHVHLLVLVGDQDVLAVFNQLDEVDSGILPFSRNDEISLEPHVVDLVLQDELPVLIELSITCCTSLSKPKISQN
jgi:hypothetical protein